MQNVSEINKRKGTLKGRPNYKDPNFPFWLLPLSVLIVFTLQAVYFYLVCNIIVNNFYVFYI